MALVVFLHGTGVQAAVRPTTSPAPATLPALPDSLITPEQAAAFYATEFGAGYNPADLRRLYEAHLLIERYFAATSEAQRKVVESRIEATRLRAAVLGRLCHLRLTWPDLAPGVYYVNEQVGPFPVKYFLGVPRGYRRAVSWPLVIKLPTANAFLTDPPPTADDVARLYDAWVNDELAAHPDALVLMPLLNLGYLYGPGYEGMNAVIQPMLHAASKANIDPARVYLMGHSMAAHAVWNLALHYTTYFAAVCPLAGAASEDWQRLRLMNLRNVLPVVWHDADDQVIPVRESRGIVEAMRKLKLDVDYEETNGVGHAPGPAVVERAYQQMRNRVRDLYPSRVAIQSNRPDTLFNRVDWVQVYQPTNPGPDRTIRVGRSRSFFRVNQNTYKIDAAVDHNKVTVVEDNVDALRLYFNDRMVDLSRPVAVYVNGRERYEGVLPQSVNEMMKDQLFLGRGWRYFTAVLDIDMGAPALRPATRPATQPPHGKIEIIGPDGNPIRTIEPKSQSE